MSNKKKAAFTPTPDWLRTWVEDKDRIYWNATKHAKGIKSYAVALKSMEDYHKGIKIGYLKTGQRKISYFSKAWGWDWRKTLRFIVAVMEALGNLDASFYLKKLKKLATEQGEKVKSHVYKSRGKKLVTTQADDTESEIEKAFLDAMYEVAKTNKDGYRKKVKANLRASDPATLENFLKFKEEREQENKRRKEELEIKEFDFEAALKDIRVNGKQVAQWRDRGAFFDVWFRGQEHWPNPVTQLSKVEIVKSFKKVENPL